MPARAPGLPQNCPKERPRAEVIFEGRGYPLLMENGEWRLRSRAKSHPADFRTGTSLLPEAKRRAKDWLTRRASNPITSRKGGGSLEALATVYLATPKRTQSHVADDNVSRLRTVCRVALGRELEAVTCREAGPELWTAYQKAALAKKGLPFDLAKRNRENIPINAAVRAARCLFLPKLRAHYLAAGLDVRPDAGEATILPTPYVPPSVVDGAALLIAWQALEVGSALWLVIGIALSAGLRREEIACLRAGWVEDRNGVVGIALRDRPEEKFWTKTGKPYFAQIIDATLGAWLLAAKKARQPDALIVPDPSDGLERGKWFERVPQQWLRAQGVTSAKPLHRLRGLYADAIAKLTADAVAARLAGVNAARDALGHTSAATTEKHYLSR